MIEVVSPGPLATVQDTGRPGYAHLGIGRSGAADRGAHAKGNRRVGNPESAASIEITLGGFRARFDRAATIALSGARCRATSGERVLEFGVALTLPAGAELVLGTPERGLRTYLAVRGGIAVQPHLGSCSTDILGGVGPAPLAAGDVLAIGPEPPAHIVDAPLVTREILDVLPIVRGPRDDWFRDASLHALTSETWTVDPTSNRVGVRLIGPVLQRLRTGELPSEPTLRGAIQVPPNGQPIVLGPDAPVTGGYPVIAVVHSSVVDQVFQARPGDPVRFTY